MTSMCSNPNCDYVKNIKGDVCPECGSPVKEMGFREGTKIIQLKKDIRNGKKAKIHERAMPRMYDEIEEDNKKQNEKVKNVAKGSSKLVLRIVLLIAVVISCIVLFPIGLISLLLIPALLGYEKKKERSETT